MSRKSSQSVRSHRSRKTRSSKYFSIETLERREMMAADLGLNLAAPLFSPIPVNAPTAAVGSMTAGENGVVDGGVSGTTGGNTASFALNDFAIQSLHELQQIPPELGVTFSNGVLTITGTHGADNIEVVAKNGTLYVREVVKDQLLFSMQFGNLTPPPILNQKVMAFISPFGPTLQRIVVNANGGDDWIKIDEGIHVPVTLHGGSGNDTLMGGRGADYILGGPGHDKILGGEGDDSLHGDQGDDLIVGGDGNDHIHGGDGNDYLLGGDGNDLIYGENGDDQLFGEAGDDALVGGSGQNLLDGGTGNDLLIGGDGIDAIYGGDGDDVIRGLAGDDKLRGEGGNDDIVAGDGDDIVDAGDGNDYAEGNAGNDVIAGGNGNDTIYGGADQDWINGESGNDILYGDAGNDFIQGEAGSDQINGGSGSNMTYQDNAPGTQYGQITQSLGLGDIGDFFGDVWDGIVGVFNWTVDKAKSIGMRFYDWAANLDDRLFRLAGDLAGALTNWPWEAEFWKGLGRTLVDALEVVGLGEAWEIAFEILKPWQRGMTSTEIAVARGVFGDSIPWDRVRLDEHSLMAWIGRTHVTGYLINSTENLDDRTMIHELTHVWQYVTDGLVYIPEAIAGQSSDDGYDFGGVNGLRDTMNAGGGMSAYNREQQGEIVASYFELIQQARAIETSGGYAPADMREKLDVFVHFVKEVSTLTAEQLDALTPPRFRPPLAADILFDRVATKTAGKSAGTTPNKSTVLSSSKLALEAVFTLPTSPVANKSSDTTNSGARVANDGELMPLVTSRSIDEALALMY